MPEAPVGVTVEADAEAVAARYAASGDTNEAAGEGSELEPGPLRRLGGGGGGTIGGGGALAT